MATIHQFCTRKIGNKELAAALNAYDRELGQALGDEILFCRRLLGFDVKCAIDGDSDDLGGIIETYITPVLELETDDLGEIKEAIYKAANDVAVFCQGSLFVKTAESEF